jgi:hypothetical protein
VRTQMPRNAIDSLRQNARCADMLVGRKTRRAQEVLSCQTLLAPVLSRDPARSIADFTHSSYHHKTFPLA